MAATTFQPIYHDWEDVLRQRIDLYRRISHGDANLRAALKVQRHMNTINHKATFLQQIGTLEPRACKMAQDSLKDLENHALQATDDTEADCQSIKDELKKQAQGPDAGDKDAWESKFRESIDRNKERSEERWNQAEEFGIRTIRKMPEAARAGAANMYTLALEGLGAFFDDIISWLRGCILAVVEWVMTAWEHIKKFAVSVGRWFQNAWEIIKGAFTGKAMATARVENSICCVDGLKSLLKSDVLARQLERTGLDNFTLVRKGNGWRIQPM